MARSIQHDDKRDTAPINGARKSRKYCLSPVLPCFSIPDQPLAAFGRTLGIMRRAENLQFFLSLSTNPGSYSRTRTVMNS
jgi:hypothetical protein